MLAVFWYNEIMKEGLQYNKEEKTFKLKNIFLLFLEFCKIFILGFIILEFYPLITKYPLQQMFYFPTPGSVNFLLPFTSNIFWFLIIFSFFVLFFYFLKYKFGRIMLFIINLFLFCLSFYIIFYLLYYDMFAFALPNIIYPPSVVLLITLFIFFKLNRVKN